MWTIALFVLKVAKVKVDMVKAIEGGAGLKHQQRHEYTITSFLRTAAIGQ